MMRWLKLFFLSVMVGSTILVAAREETLDELKARAESADLKDRASLCVKIADRQLRNADNFYSQGKIDQARAAVNDIVTYTEQARDSAIQSRKRLKKVEIAARKMADKLRDIKRTLNFEDQAPVSAAIKRLEDVRTTLLNAMFSKRKK
jgi:hypothetical protein